MPDNGKYISKEELYKGLAAHNPGLTEDQFNEKMSNTDNSFRVWKNLNVNKTKGIPTDYSQFTKIYGFDQPSKPKEPAPAAPEVPNIMEQQAKMDADAKVREEQEKHDLTNGALLATGQWIKTPSGDMIPKDPHANRDDLLKKGADDYFENFLSSDQKKALPYVNAYYSAKTPYLKQDYANIIKTFDADWKPMPPAQWSQMQQTKSSMYLDQLMKGYKLDSTQKSAIENADKGWSPEQKAAIEQGGELKGNIDKDAGAYASMTYLGKNADDPSAGTKFLSHLGQGLSAFATEGVFNPDTQDEWNKRATDILQKNGVALQTEEQAKSANPTFGDKLASVSGSGASIILPMIAGSWAGEMMSLPTLTKGLSSSPNKIMALGGKIVGKSLESAVPLQLMNWKQSVAKTGAQAGVFTMGDMIMDRIPYKPVSAFGKIILGTVKGIASGAAYTALEPTVKAGYEAIKNDESFQKEYGKYSPETQDYVSQMAMMGVMGGFGGPHVTEEQKMKAENELLKDNKKDVVESADQIFKTNNTDKINASVADMANTPGQPGHAPFPVQDVQPVRVNDERPATLKHDKDLQIEKNKPSSDKAMIKDFKAGDENDKESESFQKEANKKGLIVKRIPLENKDGVSIGTRMIVTDPKHTHLGDRISELSTKELTTGLTPDETHEIGALTGHDNVKWLESAKKQSDNQGVKDQYDAIIKNIKDKTVEGNGAKNEVAQQLRSADDLEKEGHKTEAFKARQQAEVTALKYGGKVHWEGQDLKVEFGDEKVSKDTFLKSDNADKLVQAVKGGDVEAAKEIGNKEGLNVRETTEEGEPNIQVHDGEKLVMQTNDKAIEDYESTEDIKGIMKAIGNTESPQFKESVQIEGMKPEEVKKGLHDYNNNLASVERTKLLEAANKMVTEGVITDKNKYEAKDFRKLAENINPGVKSPVNFKPDVKFASKEGETSIEEVKKKAEAVKPEEEYSDEKKKGIVEAHAETDKFIASAQKEYDAAQKERAAYIEKNGYPQTEDADFDKLVDAKFKAEEKLNKFKKAKENLLPLPEEPQKKSEGQVLFDKLDKYGKEAFPRVNRGSSVLSPKELEKAIADVKKGKENQGTKDLMSTLEETAKNKEIEIGKAGALGTGRTSVPLDTYMKELEKPTETEEQNQQHKDYEDYVNKLGEDELSAAEENIGREEEGLGGEVQKAPEGGEGKNPEKGEINTEDITAAGIGGVGKEIHKGIVNIENSAMAALGINPGVDVKDISPTLQPYAKGWNDAKGAFVENFNKNLKPEELKTNLMAKVDELRGQGNTKADKIQNNTAADILENFHDAIRTQGDADNVAKIVNQQNRFFIAGHEYYANTLKEVEAMKDFRRPQKPVTRKQMQDLKNNLIGNIPNLMDALEGKTESDRVGDKGALNKAWGIVNKGLLYMSHIHTYAPQEIRGKTQEFIRNVREPLTKVRHSDVLANVGMKSAITEALKDKNVNPEKISQVLMKEFYEGKENNNVLNDDEKNVYHTIKDWLKTSGQDMFKEAYKYYNRFWDMNPEDQKKYLASHQNYMEKNAGYLPAQRGEGEWAVTGFGKNPDTGKESRYFNKFKTEAEAKKETERLKSEGYVGVSEESSDKGYGGKAPEEEPKYYRMKPLEEISHGEVRSINDFEQALDKSGISQSDKENLMKVINDKDLFVNEEDRKTINAILSKAGIEGGLQDRVINSLESLKKANRNPHFMERSRDVEGNIVHGFDSSMKGILDRIEQFNSRAIQNKARASANYVYDKGKDFLKGNRYADTRKDMEAMMSNINEGTVTPKGMQMLQNGVYYGFLAAKPKQVVMNLLHNALTVFPDAGNEIDIINKERAQQGLPPYKEWSGTLGLKAIGEQSKITASIIKGKPITGVSESLKNVIHHLGARGSLQGVFDNYINGQEATQDRWKMRAAFTGFTDLATRVHAAVIAHDLGVAKGLKGDALNDYAEKFVDRNKFEFDKYNAPQAYNSIKITPGMTPVKKAVNTLAQASLKNTLMLKSFMFQDLGWNKDYLQRAENKPAAFARVAIPRLIVSGGLAKTIAAFGGVGVAGIEGILETFMGRKTDEDLRKKAISLVGKDMGNSFADLATYGSVGQMTGTDTRSLMDAGNFISSDLPIADQMSGAGNSFMKDMGGFAQAAWNDDWSKALQSLPGEAGNIAKAIHYYNLKQRNIPLYSGMGTKIVPQTSDIARKLLGFSSMDWDKYYAAEGFKHDMLGNGTMILPDPKSKVGQIQNAIRDGVEKGDAKKVAAYKENPTKGNFIDAFGKKLYNNVDDYNNELFDHYYMAKQSMNPQDFKDATKILSEVKKYAIGVTHEDKTWMDIGSINNHFIKNAIRSEKKREK